MRSLALAGIVLLLAGCSLPYEGTSFKANPAVEKNTVVEKGEEGPEARGSESATAQAVNTDGTGSVPAEVRPSTSPQTDAQGKEDTYPDAPSTPRTYEKNGGSQTGAVFPPTAQPGQ